MKQSIRVVLYDKYGNLILQKRDDKKGVAQRGKITFFGGGVEKDEMPIDATIREMKEELNLSVNKDRIQFIKTVVKGEEEVFIYKYRNVNSKELELKEGQSIIILSSTSNLDDYELSINTRKLIEFLRTQNEC